MAGENVRMAGPCDFWRLVDEIEERYAPILEEVGLGALTDLKKAIDSTKAFLELLEDDRVDFRVKLADYGKLRQDLLTFCDYYAKWLGSLARRLEGELLGVINEVIWMAGKQELIDAQNAPKEV